MRAHIIEGTAGALSTEQAAGLKATFVHWPMRLHFPITRVKHSKNGKTTFWTKGKRKGEWERVTVRSSEWCYLYPPTEED